eukprot:2831796-Amphidinium_carterae.1
MHGTIMKQRSRASQQLLNSMLPTRLAFLEEVATELEQHLVAEESLPLPLLNRINDAVRTCEERQMLSGKSDAIPDALLMSALATKVRQKK